MAFADETKHYSRSFECGWGDRPEQALEVAERVQALNRTLAEIEPEHRELWPLFAARPIRPGRDPGPVLDMTVEEFADLIDRRTRWDPPRWPKPVSVGGYSFVMSANRTGRDILRIGLRVRAGRDQLSQWSGSNEVEVDYHVDNPIWRDVDRGLMVLHALIECMSPEWACARGFVSSIVDGEGKGYSRPWMAWTRAGGQIPARLVERGGPPAEIRADHGGEVRIWP